MKGAAWFRFEKCRVDHKLMSLLLLTLISPEIAEKAHSCSNDVKASYTRMGFISNYVLVNYNLEFFINRAKTKG